MSPEHSLYIGPHFRIRTPLLRHSIQMDEKKGFPKAVQVMHTGQFVPCQAYRAISPLDRLPYPYRLPTSRLCMRSLRHQHPVNMRCKSRIEDYRLSAALGLKRRNQVCRSHPMSRIPRGHPSLHQHTLHSYWIHLYPGPNDNVSANDLLAWPTPWLGLLVGRRYISHD